MTWKEAVNHLANRADEWAPRSLGRHWHSMAEHADVRTLELTNGNHRLYLEPATWAEGKLPTFVDLWSSLGPRVRFKGPVEDEGESWTVLSSDLVDMHMAWNQESFARLCNDLLTAYDRY